MKMLLTINMASLDPVIQEMFVKIKEKFDKYWHNYSVILAIIYSGSWSSMEVQYYTIFLWKDWPYDLQWEGCQHKEQVDFWL